MAAVFPDWTEMRCLPLLLLVLAVPAWSAPANPEADLKRVQQRIEQLQKAVRGDTARRDKLTVALRDAEEQVRAARQRHEAARGKVAESDRRLQELADERARNEKLLAEQRDALAAQLRAAYMAGREDHLKLLLSQKDPVALGRALVYYSYLGQARAGQIAEIEGAVRRLEELAGEEQAERARRLEREADSARELAAVEAGRDAFLAGRIPRKLYATASSPLEGVIGSDQDGRS